MTNLMIRDQLLRGATVGVKLPGNSMTPMIYGGDYVVIEPLADRPVEKGDVVFCKVRGNFYLHLVTALRDGQVQISNNHGHVNGWTKLTNVYGRLKK